MFHTPWSPTSVHQRASSTAEEEAEVESEAEAWKAEESDSEEEEREGPWTEEGRDVLEEEERRRARREVDGWEGTLEPLFETSSVVVGAAGSADGGFREEEEKEVEEAEPARPGCGTGEGLRAAGMRMGKRVRSVLGAVVETMSDSDGIEE
jgi:hypothetical protein